jgi:hypothetical protein
MHSFSTYSCALEPAEEREEEEGEGESERT